MDTGPAVSPGLLRDDVKDPAKLFSTPARFRLSLMDDGAPADVISSQAHDDAFLPHYIRSLAVCMRLNRA